MSARAPGAGRGRGEGNGSVRLGGPGGRLGALCKEAMGRMRRAGRGAAGRGGDRKPTKLEWSWSAVLSWPRTGRGSFAARPEGTCAEPGGADSSGWGRPGEGRALRSTNSTPCCSAPPQGATLPCLPPLNLARTPHANSPPPAHLWRRHGNPSLPPALKPFPPCTHTARKLTRTCPPAATARQFLSASRP